MALFLRFVALSLGLLMPLAATKAAPFVPRSDDQVLERLPARAADARTRELNALRQTWRRNPADAEAAVRLARRYYEHAAAEGDPRYVGYAQAALQPWWTRSDPPVPVRVMRAILLQFNHRFEEAIADLDAALRVDPANGEAWSWRVAVSLVQADYAAAGRACEQLALHTTPLIGVACKAQVDGITGRAAVAADALRAALNTQEAEPPQRLWALTRLAEIEERLGRYAAAEQAFREALALGLTDGYLLAAYADFLLDRGRPAEVMTLLKDKSRSDILLLRLAIAAQATGDAARGSLARSLNERFDAARLRGDSTHQKEEARFALAVRNEPQRALQLARENFALQREAADARILLEAALAARQPEAAAPALQWLAASGAESVVLKQLAQRLKGGG